MVAEYYFPAQELFSGGIIIHGLLWGNDELQASMVEAQDEMVIEEAHYQTLAKQTEIMNQIIDTIYISMYISMYLCVLQRIPKTFIFKLILIAGSYTRAKNANYVHTAVLAREEPGADCIK